MQIIVKDGAFSYIYDSTALDTEKGGMITEYFPTPAEAADAAISLLWNIYPKRKLAEALLDGIPAMDYGRPDFIVNETTGDK